MTEATRPEGQVTQPTRGGAAKWTITGVVLAAVVGGFAWYSTASSAYTAEQTAINELTSLFPRERVLVLDADTEPVDDYEPEDVDMVITVAWDGADWLRGPVTTVGDPVFRRVHTVKIYDPNLNDGVIDSLMQFSSLNELHMAPEPGISRGAFGKLKRAVPDTLIYFEHDNEEYDRPRFSDSEWDEDDEEADDEEDEEWDEGEEDGEEELDEEEGLEFEGDTSLLVAKPGAFDLTNSPYSIVAKLRTVEGGAIFSQAPAEGEYAENSKCLFIADGRLQFDIGWVGTIETNWEAADDRWRWVALVFDADEGEARLYVDDEELRVESIEPTGPVRDDQVLRIGFATPDFPDAVRGFEGEIPEVAFYQRKLSLNELEAFALGNQPKQGLVAHWTRFDGDADAFIDTVGDHHASLEEVELFEVEEDDVEEEDDEEEFAWDDEDDENEGDPE